MQFVITTLCKTLPRFSWGEQSILCDSYTRSCSVACNMLHRDIKHTMDVSRSRWIIEILKKLEQSFTKMFVLDCENWAWIFCDRPIGCPLAGHAAGSTMQPILKTYIRFSNASHYFWKGRVMSFLRAFTLEMFVFVTHICTTAPLLC